MKKLILFLIIFIILMVGLLPLIDGYLIKSSFAEYIEFYQEQLQKTDKRLQLQTESYDLGWLQSTANLKITMKNGTSRVFPVKSVIHHGPLVYVNGKLHLAFAYINSTIFLPDLLSALFPQYKQGFIQINSRVSLSGNKWKNHYSIPPTHSRFINWEGLYGDVTIKIRDDDPVYIENNMTIGRIFLPPQFAKLEVTTQPFETSDRAKRVSKEIWNSQSLWKWGGMNIKWQDNRSFILNNLTYNSGSQARGSFYNQDATVTIESMQLPPPSPLFLISKINYRFSIKNLNLNGLQNLKESLKSMDKRSINAEQISKFYLQLLTPQTTLATILSMDTEAGKATANLSLSLLFLPKSENEISDSLNRQFHARLAQPLVKKVLIHYLKSIKEITTQMLGQPVGTTSDSAEHAQLILDHLIEQGVMFPDKNDYIIAYGQRGKEIVLNNKPIKEEDLDRIWENTKKDFIKVTEPTFSTMPVAPPTSPGVSLQPSIPPSSPGVSSQPSAPPPSPAVTPQPSAPPPSPGISSQSSSAPPPSPGVSSQPSAQGYHCYWMENYSGNYQWILTQTQTKEECFALDSCSGGQGKSGGGCYKWASTPQAKPEPW